MYDLHRTVKCVQILQTVVEGFFLRFSDLFRRLFAALEALVFFWASSIVPASLSDELRILFAWYCVGHYNGFGGFFYGGVTLLVLLW